MDNRTTSNRGIMRAIVCACACVCLSTLACYTNAAWGAEKKSTEEKQRDSQTVLDPNPILSPRAQGMGGALAPIADDVDAGYYNPSGIGGVTWDKKRPPFIRQLHFPYAGASVNENSQELYSDLAKAGGRSNSEVGSAVIDAHAGERQYARINLFPNIGFGRVMIGPIYDMQLAAVPLGDESDLVDLRYQERSGVGGGLSVSDPQGRLRLGVFGTFLNITDINGDVDYSEMVNPETRDEALKAATSKYAGSSYNAALSVRVAKKASPTISVVSRNVGNTKYARSSGEGEDPLVIDEDLTAGMSVSPPLGKVGAISILVEGAHLTQENMAVRKKWRAGTELTLGGLGSDAIFAIRAGGNDAGASFGAHLNLGLLAFQYANIAEDIGIDNTRLVERRQSVVFLVNVAAP